MEYLKKFNREINALEKIFEFISEFVSENKLNEEIQNTLNLIVEELFTNMVKYNLNSSSNVEISLNNIKDKIFVSITDYDVEEFDITRLKEYDNTQSLKDRPVGGLGIHLVKKLTDKISYEYKNRNSKITLIINSRKKYV